MGILLLVLKRSWSFVVMGVLVFAVIFVLNYEPIVDHYPQLLPIRNAVNPCIPIIAAIVVGIFAQGIGLVYKLFENAVTKHLEELNNVAREFLNSINDMKEKSEKLAYFSSNVPRVIDGYRLYMHIDAPLCSRYREVLSRHDGLLDDIGHHWSSAAEVLEKLRSLCTSIDEHNSHVKNLERELEEELKRLIKDRAPSKLPGANVEYLYNFVRSILLGELVPRMVDRKERFASISSSRVEELYRSVVNGLKPEEKSDGLWIGGYNVGNARAEDWESRGMPLIVELVHEVFRKYGSHLDELADEGWKLIVEVQRIVSELVDVLSYVAQAKFLPLTRICRYLG